MRRLATCVLVLLGACATAPPLADTDPFPDDGNLTAAIPIDIDIAVADRVGPSATDSADWKRFRVRSPTRVRVRFVAAGALELMMYEEEGAHIGSLTGSGGQEQVFVANLGPGVYLVEVTAVSELNAIDYTLVLEGVE